MLTEEEEIMKGLSLRVLKSSLSNVHPALKNMPLMSIDRSYERVAQGRQWLKDRLGSQAEFLKDYHHLPLEAFAGFTFEELCKFKYSSLFMMHQSVEDLFSTDPRYELFRKIKSSMWRWGMRKENWNQVADAYRRLQKFSLAAGPDFEIRLDYTTGYNERGYTKFSRTYCDGVFALLIYYRRRHVMTIGFSIMSCKRILIQQVQSPRLKGNRMLFRLPSNRLEYAIDMFRKNFPGYKIYAVDGASLVEKIMGNYQSNLDGHKEQCQSLRDYRKRLGKLDEFLQRALNYHQENIDAFADKIRHLNADRDRLVSFYGSAGRHVLGEPEAAINGLQHRRVMLEARAKKALAHS